MKKPKPFWQNRASILIADMQGRPWFTLTIYGVTTKDLCTVSLDDPGLSGGQIVAAALKRRGLRMMQDCIASVFDVDVNEATLYNPHVAKGATHGS